MLDETFAESVIHRHKGWLSSILHPRSSAHVVLGRHLLPYSFWHAANLDFIRNPFGFYQRPFDFAQAFKDGAYWLNLPNLETAVASCRLRYPATLHPPSSILAWSRKLTRPLRAHRYIKDPASYLRELEAFSAYFTDYHCGPVYGQGENSSPIKCPWYFVAIRQLRLARPELTESQAWDTPVGHGSWTNAAHAEATGQLVNIMTPADREAFESAGIQV